MTIDIDERPGTTASPPSSGEPPQGHPAMVGFSAIALIIAACLILAAVFVRATRTEDSTTPAVSGAGAAQAGPITVALNEFTVKPSATVLKAGQITATITNGGKIQHELLVFKADLAPSRYPQAGANIAEEGPDINKVSDGDNVDPGVTQSRTIDLSTPGIYLFVCNLPGHYAAGMYEQITVQ